MNLADIKPFLDRKWDEELIPRLVEYVKVPAKSPAFDASWSAHGHLAEVIKSAEAWGRAQQIDGLKLEIVEIAGKTPCLFFDVPATNGLGGDKTVLFYGHLDKQPEMVGWRDEFGPWIPVIEDGKLYGRGAADDGYAIYAALTVIAALDGQKVPRPRCVGVIETCEESGSPDLPDYLEKLAPRFGDVQLVAGLDSGCGNYEQLWMTTSLRGLAGGTLTVEILEEGVHSGKASGIVPSSFRIARQLLNRLDDPETGRLIDPAFHAPIPDERLEQAKAAGAILGDQVWKEFPWVGCTHGPDAHAHALPTTKDPVEAILNRSWRPALSVTGAGGFPTIDSAGNVLRPKTSLKLSLRLPPTVDGQQATRRDEAPARSEPAVQRARELQRRLGRDRLERAGHRAMAQARCRRGLARGVRHGRSMDGRGRHDPVHEHARREVPARAVPDHRRARTALQRPRAERVPAHPVRQEAQRSGREHRRRGAGLTRRRRAR